MVKTQHFSALERMYLAAPINRIFEPIISISDGQAEISIELKESYFHSAGAVHGFRLLQDVG